MYFRDPSGFVRMSPTDNEDLRNPKDGCKSWTMTMADRYTNDPAGFVSLTKQRIRKGK